MALQPDTARRIHSLHLSLLLPPTIHSLLFRAHRSHDFNAHWPSILISAESSSLLPFIVFCIDFVMAGMRIFPKFEFLTPHASMATLFMLFLLPRSQWSFAVKAPWEGTSCYERSTVLTYFVLVPFMLAHVMWSPTSWAFCLLTSLMMAHHEHHEPTWAQLYYLAHVAHHGSPWAPWANMSPDISFLYIWRASSLDIVFSSSSVNLPNILTSLLRIVTDFNPTDCDRYLSTSHLSNSPTLQRS